jgi:CheY-like chemotaxis protein
MRILAVDDDPDFLDVLGERLRHAGIEMVACTNGVDALRRLDREPFDAVVVDLVMPVMDGRAVARKIRERRHLGDMPVVMMTHVGNVGRIAAASSDEPNHYVSKGGAEAALVALAASLSGRRTGSHTRP